MAIATRRVVWLVLRRPSEQSEEEKQAISLLKQQHPHLQTAIKLTEKLANSVRAQQPDQLKEWIHNTEPS